MFNSIAIDIAAFLGALYVLTPLGVKLSYRFAARCRPQETSLNTLPEPVAALFRERIPELDELGFPLIGCFDCGSLTSASQSYVAYFGNRRSSDFANVSAVLSPKGMASYLEFSTQFGNGLTIETNTNRMLPLTAANPDIRVFRFPRIQDARTLLHTHHQFADKYAAGLWAQPEPRGQEIQRLVRVIENYGPRHARIGYMRLAEDGQSYKLTWKGAYLMTWRALWPVSFLRKWFHDQAMQSELRSLTSPARTALQKA